MILQVLAELDGGGHLAKAPGDAGASSIRSCMQLTPLSDIQISSLLARSSTSAAPVFLSKSREESQFECC